MATYPHAGQTLTSRRRAGFHASVSVRRLRPGAWQTRQQPGGGVSGSIDTGVDTGVDNWVDCGVDAGLPPSRLRMAAM